MTKDAIETKLNEIDYFIHNGLSKKIIQGITTYLDAQTARRFRLFCKIAATGLIITLIGSTAKLLFF